MAGRGQPKTGGRKPGAPNRAKAELQAALEAVQALEYGELTNEMVKRMKPAEVLLAITHIAFMAKQYQLAMASAKEAAPYYNVKLISKSVDTEDADTGGIEDDTDPEVRER